MHILLERLLKKKGIESVNDLDDNSGEKEVFDRWQRILSSGEDVTVDNIKEFCRIQRSLIEKKMRDLDAPALKMAKIQALYTAYGMILEAIEGPKIERERLEKQLQSMIADE